jgi:hypothetical protein
MRFLVLRSTLYHTRHIDAVDSNVRRQLQRNQDRNCFRRSSEIQSVHRINNDLLSVASAFVNIRNIFGTAGSTDMRCRAIT